MADALVGKLRQLVEGGEAPAEAGNGSPGEILDALRGLARAAVESPPLYRDPEGAGGLGGLIVDLVHFLVDLPEWIDLSVRMLPRVPPAPPSAWEEPSSSTFWRLAALLQDIWEHRFGPEAESDPRVLGFLGRTVSGSALDFGSGAGFFAFQLARRGVAVTCVETNPVKLAFLAYRKARRPEGEKISLGPPRGRYDAVLAINVLDHLEDPAATVRDLAGRLRPGGALIICAGFPDDGWHAGGEPVREALYEELMRHFRHPELEEDGGDELLLLLRRRQRSRPRPFHPSGSRSWRRPLRARLDPAARLLPQPGEDDRWILAAPRFYARPLLLAGPGAALARLCADRRTVAEIQEAMGKLGIAPHDVIAALEELDHSHLVSFESQEPGTVA